METSNNTSIMNNKKRPILVWVIFVLFLIVFVIQLIFSGLALFSSRISKIDYETYFMGLNIVNICLSFLVVSADFIGAVLLLCLRKTSIYFFMVSFAANLSSFGWQLLNDGVKTLTYAGLVGLLFGWTIIIVIYSYAWRLKRKGVLT